MTRLSRLNNTNPSLVDFKKMAAEKAFNSLPREDQLISLIGWLSQTNDAEMDMLCRRIEEMAK